MTDSAGEKAEAVVFGASEGDRNSLAGLTLGEIVDDLQFGVVVTDDSGRVLYANAAAADLIGVDEAGIAGAGLVSLVPRRYRRTLRAALTSAVEERVAFSWELELEPRRGEEATPVEVSTVPLSGGRIAWVLQDVRDRVAIERHVRALTGDLEARVRERTAALETERARLAALMGQMPAGLVIVDAPEGNVVTANAEALRILRVSSPHQAQAWHGRRMDGIPYEADEWPLARSRLHGEFVSGERAEVVAGDGARIVLDMNSAPVRDLAGRVLGAVCIFTDVTLRERRERAEREFVTNAAHELQTPLAALISAVEVLIGGAKDTPERDLFLEHIRRESERLTRLIRALLTLARAEMGTDAPTLGIVALCPLLEAIAEDLKPAPGVKVSVACPDNLAAVANLELVEQALTNIAENAAKYTVEGELSIVGAQRGDIAEITISDTGPGISPSERPLVFERFHRGDSGRGSGLGLSIARSVAEALGGELELDSEVGVGTTVKLRLPYVSALVPT
jgi:PAS domain S-box-containing protein